MAAPAKPGDNRSSHDTLRAGIPSPRIAHFDGEIPPTLSPLDAFAAQGRFLARQLDESRRKDRRMSRLPPSSVARSLSQPRPGYFRAPSSGDSHGGDSLTRQPTQKGRPEVEEPKYRPVSEHPRFSSVSHASTDVSYYEDDDNATPRTTMLHAGQNDYGIPRAESPEEDPSLAGATEHGRVGMVLVDPSRESSTDSVSRLHIPRTLAPPVSPHSRTWSSPRMHPESSDDDYSSSNAGSTFSKPRKLSSGSAVSLPYSPLSTFATRPHPRSPSLSSETSNTGHLPRPSFNFSRPMSRSSTSLSAPGPSATSEPGATIASNTMYRTSRPTPLPLAAEDGSAAQPSDTDPPSAVSSYVYSKYSLPRGRQVSRDSAIFAGLQTPHFQWQEPLFQNSPPRRSEEPVRARTPSPPPRPPFTESPKAHSMYEVPPPHAQRPTPPFAADTPPRPSLDPKASPQVRKSIDRDDATSSADSASTLRPQTARTQGSSITLSADDHVAKGIECHENGSLQESTYHLRIAAKQNHPTGMLFYALALRHGWGIRPNQREGVHWLRKAVDSVGLEMFENPDATGASKARQLQKAYGAQFALSVYELGVSHLNGWGIEQDKSLALRCFEIAAQWGDVDAMAEAGFCYAEGIGRKKDMKKAAQFYRQAESNGMNMVGNSWIYKDKYMNEDERPARSRGRNVSGEKEKKPRSKSRTRSIFNRKKSSVPEE